MNVKKAVAVALLLAWLVLSRPLPTTSQSGIVVTGADSVLSTPFSYSPNLVDIGPRIIIEYANSTVLRIQTDLPSALEARVSTVKDRIIVEYADSVRSMRLVAQCRIYLPLVVHDYL
jgi:hypothetical protein